MRKSESIRTEPRNSNCRSAEEQHVILEKSIHTAGPFKPSSGSFRRRVHKEIKNLLEAGASVHERDEEGRTPLHMAVFNGSEEIVQLLLSAGANPNAQDHKGVTALNTARSFNGLESICRLLISAGADPDLKDNEGKIYNM